MVIHYADSNPLYLSTFMQSTSMSHDSRPFSHLSLLIFKNRSFTIPWQLVIHHYVPYIRPGAIPRRQVIYCPFAVGHFPSLHNRSWLSHHKRTLTAISQKGIYYPVRKNLSLRLPTKCDSQHYHYAELFVYHRVPVFALKCIIFSVT